jgi:NlpC/P60 family putative phage cell wall peptidase
MTDPVTLARGWLGTPYVHQASSRGAGCDCLGLIRGIWCARYGREPEPLPAYSMDWSEPQGEERLWSAALRNLPVAAAPADGDVLLFRMRDGAVAKHLGIAATGPAGPTFIHAMSGRGVVESALTDPWARRVVARFTWPEV